MSDYIYCNGELLHYGVPGMKWGVRRNARVLANNRRNRKVRDAKVKYKTGQINATEKKTAIKTANREKKEELASMKKQIRKTKNGKEFNELKKSIAKQTIEEVPHATLKKGATTVNTIFHTYNGVTVAATGATLALLSPGAAPAVGAATTIGLLMNKGEQALIQMGIDKLS